MTAYQVTSNIGLLNAQMMFIEQYECLGDAYHWIPDLHERCNLPVWQTQREKVSFEVNNHSYLKRKKTAKWSSLNTVKFLNVYQVVQSISKTNPLNESFQENKISNQILLSRLCSGLGVSQIISTEIILQKSNLTRSKYSSMKSCTIRVRWILLCLDLASRRLYKWIVFFSVVIIWGKGWKRHSKRRLIKLKQHV